MAVNVTQKDKTLNDVINWCEKHVARIDEKIPNASDEGFLTGERFALQAVAVEKKVRRRRDDIIAAVELGISNGRVEAINNKIKVTVRMGYGFRNTDNLVALLMLRCGDCQPQLPGRPVKARKKGVKGAKSVAA